MTVTEKAAFLKGMLEGMALDTAKPENKLLSELVKAVGDLADAVADLEEENKELREYIEEIDDDLGSVEEDLYADDEDEDDEDYDDDEEFYEVVCPACGEKIGDFEICDGNCAACDEDCE